MDPQGTDCLGTRLEASYRALETEGKKPWETESGSLVMHTSLTDNYPCFWEHWCLGLGVCCSKGSQREKTTESHSLNPFTLKNVSLRHEHTPQSLRNGAGHSRVRGGIEAWSQSLELPLVPFPSLLSLVW